MSFNLNDLRRNFLAVYKTAFSILSEQELQDQVNIIWNGAKFKHKGNNGKKNFVCFIVNLINELDSTAKRKFEDVCIVFRIKFKYYLNF